MYVWIFSGFLFSAISYGEHKENAQISKIYYVLLPICTVVTVVKACEKSTPKFWDMIWIHVPTILLIIPVNIIS